MKLMLSPLRARSLALQLEELVDFMALSTELHRYHYSLPDPMSRRLEAARIRSFLDDQILLAALRARASSRQ